MIEYNVEQLSEEWFGLKHGKIGGSSLSDLLADKPVKDLSLFNSIVSDLCEDFEYSEGFISDDMQRGLEMEPEAAQVVSEHTGYEFLEVGWFEHDTLNLLGVSPDRLTQDRRVGLEVKCPKGKTHIGYVKDGVLPKEYFFQVIQNFVVNEGLELFYFASYRPENHFKQLFLLEFKRDTILKGKIGRKSYEITVQEWVDMVEKRALEFQKEVFKYVDSLKF